MENDNQNLSPQPLPQVPSPKKWYRHKGLIAIAVLVILAAAAVCVYFAKQPAPDVGPIVVEHKTNPPQQPDAAPGQPFATSTPTQTDVSNWQTSPTPPPATTTPQSSSCNLAVDQYCLFDQSQFTPGNISTLSYQDDGLIDTGQYAGYHRIVAEVDYDEPGGPIALIFGTKDYQTFIADSRAKAYNFTNGGFNTAKVVGFGDIPMDSPPTTVNLGNFVLSLGQIDFSPSLGDKLPSNIPGFTLYSDTNTGAHDGSLSPSLQAYLAGSGDVYAEDGSGLYYDYSLISSEQSNRTNKNGNFYDSGEFVAGGKFYKNYNGLFPGGCGISQTYVLQNITKNDLTQITTTLLGTPLYILKDQKNPINQKEYATKVTDYQDEFKVDNGVAAPSYQDYLSKNPVLIFQDPWGRLVGIGEYEYDLPGGCGKPVIYFYPPKPTEVTVKFTTPMYLSLDIPAYNGQWDVLAEPDGQLNDLQPKATDCTKINYNLTGSEYARSACPQAIYPYLYWEGQASKPYPKAETGWVVAKDNMATFLSGKLTQIGLNEKEKTDMLDYWIPQLLSKNSPYYRLSLFQTQTMDNFIPMQVTPKPDTTIRVFLDWSPLENLPNTELQPETLHRIERKGFTLVEWGGLKQ